MVFLSGGFDDKLSFSVKDLLLVCFIGAFQRTFISDKKLKRFRTELKCSKVAR